MNCFVEVDLIGLLVKLMEVRYSIMLISVIIPTHNRAGLLQEAIESVLHQEPCGADVEIIVADDDSNDGTSDVIELYPQVRSIKTKQGNAAGTRNEGIKLAKGDWIAFLDDDDLYLPHKLLRCCEEIHTHPNAVFVHSSAWICDFHMKKSALWRVPDMSRYRSTWEVFLDYVSTPSAVMVRNDTLQRIGGFDPTFPRAEDRDLWLRIFAEGAECISINEPLILYRTREHESGDLLYSTFLATMNVLHKNIDSDVPYKVPLCRKWRIYWRIRRWYADRLKYIARQEAELDNLQEAKRFRHLANSISSFHFMVDDLIGYYKYR